MKFEHKDILILGDRLVELALNYQPGLQELAL